VINAQDLMTLELEDPTHGISDDRRSEMTHMHVFGNVGRGEIDSDLEFGGGTSRETVSEDVIESLHDERVDEEDVDEARTGDFEFLDEGVGGDA
jgi:hypothetical protein